MNDYLAKPFNNAELSHVIDRIYRRLKRKFIESNIPNRS